MSNRKNTREQIITACSNATSLGNALELLHMSNSGAARIQLKKYIVEYAIDITHFNLCKQVPHGWNKRSIDDYLSNKYKITSFKLKLRLLKENFLERKCYECSLTTWCGKEIPLELEHINGNHLDNTLSNLTLLCPNCHAFTPTYRGRNKQSKVKKQKVIKIKRINYCFNCNKEISLHALRCKSCAAKLLNPPKIEWPSKEEILFRLRTTSYTALGKELGVSDNAVRKYIQR